MLRTSSAALFAVIMLFAACGPGRNSVSDWSAWKPVPARFASKFKVWTRADDHLILVFGHGGEQDTVGRYLLSSDPDAAGPINALIVARPLRRVAMLSTTHLSYVSELGRVNAVVAAAHLDQVRDHAVRAAINAGSMVEIGTGQGADRERMLTLELDAVFTYPFGTSEGGSLGGLGIPVVEVSEYLEEHPLGRAEWLRFFGIWMGEEGRADSLFAGIVERYARVRDQVHRDSMPTVLFGSHWNGQWFVPPGNSYMAKLIDDAGGRYVFAHLTGEGNITLDMETMIAEGAGAQVWGMVTAERAPVRVSTFTANDARLEQFSAVRERRLFASNSEADLFGRSLVEPDVLLQDLVCCLDRGRCPMEWITRATPAYFMPANWP